MEHSALGFAFEEAGLSRALFRTPTLDRWVSQRMLTTTLRQLERDGLLSRHVFAEVPPRVEYELTPLGLSLLEPMRTLVHWIGSNGDIIKEARIGFDRRIQ